MPAPSRHKRVAKALIENVLSDNPLTREQLLVEKTNYTPKTAKTQGASIVSHPLVKRALEDYGFNEETAKDVVKEIARDSKTELVRLKAAEQMFKVLGSYAPEKKANLNVNLDVQGSAKESENLTAEYEEKFKLVLLNKQSNETKRVD